jgi:hypothetical protein
MDFDLGNMCKYNYFYHRYRLTFRNQPALMIKNTFNGLPLSGIDRLYELYESRFAQKLKNRERCQAFFEFLDINNGISLFYDVFYDKQKHNMKDVEYKFAEFDSLKRSWFAYWPKLDNEEKQRFLDQFKTSI